MYLKWVIIALLKKLEKKLKDLLGFMEIRSNTVVETMIENQVSYLDGLILHISWIKLTIITDFSSKIRTLKKDVSRFSKKIYLVNKLLLRTIMSMKLINSIVSIEETNLTKN